MINFIIVYLPIIFLVIMDVDPSSSTDIEFKIIDSQRGSKILLHDGYRYNIRRVNTTTPHTSWRCVRRKCPGKMITNDTIVVRHVPHDCASDKIGNEIKQRMSTYMY